MIAMTLTEISSRKYYLLLVFHQPDAFTTVHNSSHHLGPHRYFINVTCLYCYAVVGANSEWDSFSWWCLAGFVVTLPLLLARLYVADWIVPLTLVLY
jgi:hypothetical protein